MCCIYWPRYFDTFYLDSDWIILDFVYFGTRHFCIVQILLDFSSDLLDTLHVQIQFFLTKKSISVWIYLFCVFI